MFFLRQWNHHTVGAKVPIPQRSNRASNSRALAQSSKKLRKEEEAAAAKFSPSFSFFTQMSFNPYSSSAPSNWSRVLDRGRGTREHHWWVKQYQWKEGELGQVEKFSEKGRRSSLVQFVLFPPPPSFSHRPFRFYCLLLLLLLLLLRPKPKTLFPPTDIWVNKG